MWNYFTRNVIDIFLGSKGHISFRKKLWIFPCCRIIKFISVTTRLINFNWHSSVNYQSINTMCKLCIRFITLTSWSSFQRSCLPQWRKKAPFLHPMFPSSVIFPNGCLIRYCNVLLLKSNDFQKYSKTCLSRTPLGLKNLSSLCRCFGLHRFKLHRHLVDGIVKSVWLRQVFGLLRVQFRRVLGLLRVQFRKVLGLLRVQVRQVFGLLGVQFRQVSL